MTFMSSEISELDDQQKELCAILVMRTMLEDYSKDTGISYEEAFYRFLTLHTTKAVGFLLPAESIG